MPPVPFGPSKNMKKKKKQPLNRFDPGTPASNAVDITTTLQYLLTWSTQVNILWVALYSKLSNCKQNITWLSLFVGTIVHVYCFDCILTKLLIWKCTHMCMNRNYHRLQFTFQSNPLMNLSIFVTVHSLMKDINLIDSCKAYLPVAICFEHGIHSPEVTMMLCLTASHTWGACAKQASCLLHWMSVFTVAVPPICFTLQHNR